MALAANGVVVKVCGVTSLDDARAALDAGADWLGLNFWRGSVRRCAPEVAAQITQLGAPVVGVFVDASLETIRAALAATGVQRAQLHGDEPPEWLAALGDVAFKALRVRGPETIADAARFVCTPLLLDAYLPGAPGGTGATFDWSLAARLAAERPVLLAGGLTAENVADAVRAVRPFGVDVASGVERAPGVKDVAKLRAFVQAARAA